MGRRAIVVVLDACGAGAMPDAADYGDPPDANTLLHVAEAVGGLRLPTLQGLGLGSILPLPGVPAATQPSIHGRLHPLGVGKDSTTGHWELMGVVMRERPPAFPDGLPASLLDAIESATAARFCCNAAASGTDVIEQWGGHHLRSGEPILYTSSADSVVQVAAHVDVLDERALHELCGTIREQLHGPDAVGRVIARPFRGRPGALERTEGRRDFALAPPTPSYLDVIADTGAPVHAVGKAHDLFAGRGIDAKHPGATNEAALISVAGLLDELERGLVFANLVETDQVYGHRHDSEGFHDALRRVDAGVAGWLPSLGPDDLLVLTADHGVDPTAGHRDHTREHVPLLAVAGTDGGVPRAGHRHDGPLADVGATVLAWLTGGRSEPSLPGTPFAGT